MTEFLIRVGSWFGTFAFHSTVLLLAVWLVRRWLRGDEALEELLWRVAMFGGVVTASVQRWLGSSALPGWNVNLVGAEPATASSSAAIPVGATADLAPAVSSVDPGSVVWLPVILIGAAVVYGGVVLVLVAVRVRGWWAFLRCVGDRVPLWDVALLRMLVDLVRAAGMDRPVRLSASASLSSPIVFGLLRREICLPTAVLERMGAAQQRCVLAHEVAHLRDRDPRWLAAYELWTCVFFFQPLLRVARRRLRDLAEFRCDAWVVRQTGDRVGMAKTLVEVAEWFAGHQSSIGGFVPAMAHGNSGLKARVKRILHAGPTVVRLPGWLTRSALCGVLAGISVGVPGVSLVQNHAHDGSEVVPPLSAAGDPIHQQLIALEGDIADLHSRLATTWRLLEGRDIPAVTAALQTMQKRLLHMTEERMVLWREATAARDSDARDLDSERWKPKRPETNNPERSK